MKLTSFILFFIATIFFSCTKETPITRPVAVSETQETTVEDRACGTSQIQLRIMATNPVGQKAYVAVFDEDGSTRYVYPWACGSNGCIGSPCLDALDNTFYQTFTVDKCEKIKVELSMVCPLFDCSDATGNVSIQIKKNGTATVRQFTLQQNSSNPYPSKCFYIDSNGNVGPAETCL